MPASDPGPADANLEYHLRELRIAQDPSDPRRCMPVVPDSVRSLLDVGCGAGQTIEGLNLPASVRKVGVDIDRTSLAYGRKGFPNTSFVCAAGEALPFRDGQFDMVISRVAAPYMRFPEAPVEMARVLRPGGMLWLSLHPLAMVLDSLRRGLASLRLRPILFNSYVLANGLLLHFGGRTTPFPLARGRTESFQTGRGIRRVLERAGFRDAKVVEDRQFVVAALRK